MVKRTNRQNKTVAPVCRRTRRQISAEIVGRGTRGFRRGLRREDAIFSLPSKRLESLKDGISSNPKLEVGKYLPSYHLTSNDLPDLGRKKKDRGCIAFCNHPKHIHYQGTMPQTWRCSNYQSLPTKPPSIQQHRLHRACYGQPEKSAFFRVDRGSSSGPV